MSTVSIFRVTADWFGDAEVTLRVDSEVLTKDLATEINQFWSSADERLRDEGGDVVRAVVRLFGTAAIRYFMADGGASFGPTPQGDTYQTDAVIKSQSEGWPDCHGLGILIVAAEVAAVGYEDVTLESV